MPPRFRLGSLAPLPSVRMPVTVEGGGPYDLLQTFLGGMDATQTKRLQERKQAVEEQRAQISLYQQLMAIQQMQQADEERRRVAAEQAAEREAEQGLYREFLTPETTTVTRPATTQAFPIHPDAAERAGREPRTVYSDEQVRLRAAGREPGPPYPVGSSEDRSGQIGTEAIITPEATETRARKRTAEEALAALLRGGQRIPAKTGDILKQFQDPADKYMAVGIEQDIVNPRTGEVIRKGTPKLKPEDILKAPDDNTLEAIIESPEAFATHPWVQAQGGPVAAQRAARGIRDREQGRAVERSREQGKAAAETSVAALVGRERTKYAEVALGDEAGKWIGPGGKPVNPGLSRQEAVQGGARPLGSVEEAKALRQAAGITRYIQQYMEVLPLYPEEGSSDAANLAAAGMTGAKLWLGRKSGGAATKVEALQAQITRLIRAFGDTANAAVAERAQTLQAVPGYVETRGSATTKLRTIIEELKGMFEDYGVDPPPVYDQLLRQLEGRGAAGTTSDPAVREFVDAVKKSQGR